MIIIIPLGGVGQRFHDYGYIDPKPLIKVHGKELIFRLIDSLKVEKDDRIYIIYNSELQFYNFEDKILFKEKNINFLKLNSKTKGPAETVYNLTKVIIDESINEKVIIIDGDIFFKFDILKKIRKEKNNSIFYFKTKEIKPIYSYIKIQNNFITDIKEKKIISNNANLGAYYFSNIYILNQYLKNILKKKSSKLFISDVYRNLISDKIKIKAIKINNNLFEILGTPQQLTNFAIKNKSKKINIDFYFDGLFRNVKNTINIYENYIPIEKNIKFINFLFFKKNHINIILSHNNIKKFSQKNYKKIIHSFLQFHKVDFNEIIYVDRNVDFIINHNTINSLDNLNVKLGFYENDYTSRDFNNVFVGENLTIKKSTNYKKLQSEVNFYKKIPRTLKNLFPNLVDYNKNSYKIETINGVLVSYLFLNKLLQNDSLKKILITLDKIHSFNQPLNNVKKINIYENYSNKFKQRIKHASFEHIKHEENFFKNINDKLVEYKKLNLGKMSIIHGDPVFSNIFIDISGKIKFVDPRGEINENDTIYGDMFYDYAKIYQSLTGFEQVSKHIDINHNFYTEKKLFFEHYFKSKFPDFDFNFLKILTSSLYISLIPFQDLMLAKKFLKLSKEVLKK